MKLRLALAALALVASPVFAEEKPAAPAAPAAPAEEKRYAPGDLAALRALVGQKVTVEGKVEAQGESKAGNRYLNFTKDWRNSVALFFAQRDAAVFTKEKLAEYVGKTLRVSGTLVDYNGNLQIKVTKLDELVVVPAPEAAK